MDNDLVRKSDVLKALEQNSYDEYSWYSDFVDAIQKMPSVPQKTGRWESCYDYYRCSECGEEDYVPRGFCNEFRWEYCPYCGARMEGEAE